MKKRIILSLIISWLLNLSVQAQFFARMNMMTPHYYPGEVYFKDGHQDTYAEVELPRVGKSALSVRKNADDKKRTDIEAIDIVGIKFWHKDFPDSTHMLYYVHAKTALMQNEHQWGFPIIDNAWGTLFQCEQYYEIDDNGEMNCVKLVGGSYPDTPTLFYLKRPEWDEAQMIIFGGDFALKKKVAKFFQENAQIAKGIKSGKLKPSDIRYIMDTMAEGKTE